MVEQNQIIQSKIQQLHDTLGVDFVGMALATTNEKTYRKEIRWKYVSGNISLRYQKIVLQEGRGLPGIVWRTGRTLIEADLEQRTAEELLEYPIALTEELKSVGVVPVFFYGDIVAILLIGYRQPNRVTLEVVQQLTEETASVAVLIQEKKEAKS
ncbi:GAF domain-containing protein [Carnobacterium gallinarum]|uniref:GAF domain-containing protein n=1 Tax=Carnobacterium gallinarum TaxID=2749 RepID=UPI000691A38A|nr:GAF domain-containing protein [Carnobacterium gallinarum]